MTQPGDTGAQPLQGVVLCCTSLPQETRVTALTATDLIRKTSLAQVAVQMGAVHKLDLTSDVTHLLVGNIDTPKYRYVAKDRPDIRVLFPDFIDAVRTAWMHGGEVDVPGLEQKHSIPPFHGLHVCLTGFDNLMQRKEIEHSLTAGGAEYHGDLTKSVTHLIAARPEGPKYTHAVQWRIRVVGLKWYEDCLTRGMAVDESLYNPQLPREQQGIGAFRTIRRTAQLGKRVREDEENVAGDESSRRKLRRVATTRLDSQSQDVWRNISQAEVQVDNTVLDAWNEGEQTSTEVQMPVSIRTTNPTKPTTLQTPQGLFSGCYILIHGFETERAKKLRAVMQSNGAAIVQTPEELEKASHNPEFQVRCLLVPHNLPTILPEVPPGTLMVTEWWAERCLHYKQQLSPDSDTLSTPLCDARVSDFQKLVISTTGFSGVDLRQIAEVVKLMGAVYQEQLLPSTTVLVCASDAVKQEKAFYASKYRIPAVSVSWLWDSLNAKKAAHIDDYQIALSALNSTELAVRLSNGTSATSASRPVDITKSDIQTERVDEYAHPKRLSNTRKRHATPSLLLKSSKPNMTEPRKTRAGPFILEDDDEPAMNGSDGPSGASHPVPSQERALCEMSPNASQHGPDGRDLEECRTTGGMFKEPTVSTRRNGPVSSPKSSPKSPRHYAADQNTEQLPPKPIKEDNDFTNDLASILQRRTSSNSAKSTAGPLKRKYRPLGRNLSGTSIRSESAAVVTSPALPAEPPESVSLADGFYISRDEPVAPPPSTQLGYETPEEQAHRVQMSKKMGTKLIEEGTRLTTATTIKDSADVVARAARLSAGAGAGRAKTRNRGKP